MIERPADGMPPNAAGELGRGAALPLSALAMLAVWTLVRSRLAALALAQAAGAE